MFGLTLVILSALIYYIHYLIFHDAHHIFLYLIGDIAFIPIDVFIVTLIIENLLNSRDKRSRLKKMNMVIGTFFYDVGVRLLEIFSNYDKNISDLRSSLTLNQQWTTEQFNKTIIKLQDFEPNMRIDRDDLIFIRDFLLNKRDFLLSLLANPNLLEHESFTDLLWASFHLTEELAKRNDLTKIPDPDLEHLAGDVKRAYKSSLSEWTKYMKHLKADYPYLFSLAMRTNPFNPSAKVEVM